MAKARRTFTPEFKVHAVHLVAELALGLGESLLQGWKEVLAANDFVFFARRGELASNRREDHEVSMLALHLLQNCMIYVNTLMLQQVLE